MFPTDSINEQKHVRLMEELKSIYCSWYDNATLIRAIRLRMFRLAGRNASIRLASYAGSTPANYFSEKRIAVYTSIYGPYDQIREPIVVPDNCDFYILTDQEVPQNSVWQKLDFDFSMHLENPDNVSKNRFVKFFPDLLFSDYDFTIYIDGKYQIRTDLTELIQDMNPHGLRMFRHPLRNCVYDEIKTCQRMGKGSAEHLRKHQDYLASQGLPRHYGMVEGGFIVRQTGHAECQTLMKDWWQAFNAHSRRDQVSLPYVLWQKHIPIESIGDIRYNIWANPVIRKFPHRRVKKEDSK